MVNIYERSIGRLITGLFVVAALLSGCAKPASEEHAVTKEAATVRAETLVVASRGSRGAYSASGQVMAQYSATLSSKVLGRVLSVMVREGDIVKAGQTLLKIDSRDLSAAVDVAESSYKAAVVGVDSAKTVATMQSRTSAANIQQAESKVSEAESALAAAQSRYALVKAGPRTQEVEQSHIAVVEAKSNLDLAKTELHRSQVLVDEGAIAKRDLELAQNRYEVALARYNVAVQSESIAREGSRKQEIQGAEQAVAQADAAVRQAKSALATVRANALQVDVRKKDVEVAGAQANQAAAMAQSARVNLSYGLVTAPFDGRVTKRFLDPGAMASPGLPLLTVEGGPFLFETAVPETLIGSLVVGTHAKVFVDALAGGAVDGRVLEIVPAGDATAHSFLVKFELENSPGLRSGMFGRADIGTGTTSTLRVPASATWTKEGLDYIFVVNAEGVARLRIVTLGKPLDGQVEVLSGLSDGERVVIGDRKGVQDGVRITEG